LRKLLLLTLALPVLLVTVAATVQAQTYSDLYNLGSNSGDPTSPAQTFTTLHSFDYTADGAYPVAALVQVTDGNLYATTSYGGAGGFGTVFKITPSGTLRTLHSFHGTNGAKPYAGMVQAADGNLYATTSYGGAKGYGTVFRITPSGTLLTLHSFCSKTRCTDGAYPYAGLVQATDGNFYGTTTAGGATNHGTVFKITPSGTLTTLHSFAGFPTDGSLPYAGMVQAADGNFYGTTVVGGAHNRGTVFKITPSGTLRTLHSFDGTDGQEPYAGMVQATDGNFYGTTYEGGSNACSFGCGTVFKITPSGTLRTLHSFDGTDGQEIYAGLVQDTNGNFYGTTRLGGAHSYGTVFSLSVGLGPFVETQPTSGKVGAARQDSGD